MKTRVENTGSKFLKVILNEKVTRGVESESVGSKSESPGVRV